MTPHNLAHARQISDAVEAAKGCDPIVLERPLMLELDKTYEDRRGHKWTVISTANGQRPCNGPVSAARWVGKEYKVRTFLRDGSYWPNETDPWDLVREAE